MAASGTPSDEFTTLCNFSAVPPVSSSLACTGSFLNCVSNTGVFDMLGGVEVQMKAKQLFVSLITILLSAGSALATSYSWNVASGDWFTATNWSPNGVPGSADDATISNGGTATLDSDTTVNTFTLSSGTLTGIGNLDVSGLATWTGGTMSGTGTTTANAGLAISGAGDKFRLTRTLVQSGGSGSVSGTDTAVHTGAGAVFTNASGATFEFQSDGGGTNQGFIYDQAYATTTVNNYGTLRKAAGNTGTSRAEGAFNNTGTWRCCRGS